MREMDTESPVVWPAWCYSGEASGGNGGGSEGDTAPQPASVTAQVTSSGPLKSRAKRPPARMQQHNGIDLQHHNNNNNSNSCNNSSSGGAVKNERLSPAASSACGNSSPRSRSVTPSSSSVPGTPPGPLEHAMGRNYSDFMRSLAAKYNNVNPNEFFNSPVRNGLLDPGFAAQFKPGSPFAGLLAPLTTSNALPKEEPSIGKKTPNLFAAGLPMFPPMIDMSSTQALIAMVRQAKEDEINALSKSGTKRAASDLTTPLDLSSAAPGITTGIATKKARQVVKNTRRGGSESPGPPASTTTATGTTTMVAATTVTVPMASGTPSASRLTPHAATTPKSCSGQCTEASEIASWGVDDVVNFVSSIDICAEYASNFREQRIDGAGLPLLTEEHLTTTMNMKLGPALKLKSLLARKIGSCSMCLHCFHCHSSSSDSSSNNSGCSPAEGKRPSSSS